MIYIHILYLLIALVLTGSPSNFDSITKNKKPSSASLLSTEAGPPDLRPLRKAPSTTNTFRKLKRYETYRINSIAKILSSLHSAAKGCPMPRPWTTGGPGRRGPCGAAVVYGVAWSRVRSRKAARFSAATLENQGIWRKIRFDIVNVEMRIASLVLSIFGVVLLPCAALEFEHLQESFANTIMYLIFESY